MADASVSNSEWVISVKNGVKLDDGTVLTPQQATWWLGGAEAGALYNQSLTYSRYPNALEACPKLTDAQIEEAIKAGKLFLLIPLTKLRYAQILTHLPALQWIRVRNIPKTVLCGC